MIEGIKEKIIAICSADINETYNNSFYNCFYHSAEEFHFKLLFFTSLSSLYYTEEKHSIGERNIFNLINYDILDGMIILSESIKDFRVVEKVAKKALEHNIPTVSIDHYVEGCYNISFDYDTAMEEIIRHFVEEHEFRRINFIAGIKDNDFSENRLNIFRKVMAENNIPVEEERIGYGEFWAMPTEKVMDDFLNSDLPMPEAIICANDSMAIIAFQRLVDAGYRVPEDVAVSGFDGIEEALKHVPSFTTARHDFEKTSLAAYQILTDVLNGKVPEKMRYIPSKVIYGGTCGCQTHLSQSVNHLTRKLYERIDQKNSMLVQHIQMAADLTDNASYDSLISNMEKYVFQLSTPFVWICCLDNFMTETSDIENIFDDSSDYYEGYSETIVPIINRFYGDFLKWDNFPARDLLPNLKEVLTEQNNVMFLPLHVLDRATGYMAFTYLPDVTILHDYYTFITNISNSLESTRTKIKQQIVIQNLQDKYIHDPMTGLLNRRGFYQFLNPMYEECISGKKKLMVVSADLNGLKPINDTYGHQEGDTAITTVAQALMAISKENEICARFGGDEYVVAGVLEADESYTKEYEAKFNAYLDEWNKNSGKPYEVSASIGIVVCTPSTEQTLDQCIKEADDKMYTIKAKHHLCRSR